MIRLFLTALLAVSLPVLAAIDTYEFSTDEQRERFFNLNFELRCPKCQNQSLSDSNAPIAEDLRAEVYRLIIEGKSDPQIKSYLVDRYGEYVLYRPPFNPMTYALWILPGLGVILGLAVIVLIIRRSRQTPEEATTTLSESEQRQLQSLLQSKPDSAPESTKEKPRD